MTEDGEPPLTPESPFEPERVTGVDLQKPALVGCGVGCSVLLVLGIILLVVLSVKTEEVWSWFMRAAHETLIVAAPDDWTDADDAELRAAFEGAGRAITANRADVESSLEMYQELRICLQKATRQELRRSDLLELTRALRAVAGQRSSERGPGDLVSLPARREVLP